MKQVIVCRHAEQPRLGAPIVEFRPQQLAERLTGSVADGRIFVVTSNVDRAAQTAALIGEALGIAPVADDGFSGESGFSSPAKEQSAADLLLKQRDADVIVLVTHEDQTRPWMVFCLHHFAAE